MSRTEAHLSGSQYTSRGHAWKRTFGWCAGAMVVLGVCLWIRFSRTTPEAAARSPGIGRAGQSMGPSKNEATSSSSPLPRVGLPQHDVMAVVNGQEINRAELIDASVHRHGKEVLESLVNKRLILNHCEKRKIAVTREEIDAEIDRMASRFKLGRDGWLEMLEKERGLTAQEYARDVVWPTLALRKLAAGDLEPLPEEIEKEYQTQYGRMVRARLIAVRDETLARQLRDQLVQEPDRFARIAMDHSEDVNSASVGGLIQPIRRHVGSPAIEKEAFRLQPGEISSIIQAGNQWVLLKCEGHILPSDMPLEQTREQIVEQIKEKKLREVGHSLFGKLQKTATIQNVYNHPKLREKMPGVVATVNGERITMQALGKECLLRKGKQVLEVEISHRLLQQALDRAQITVTDADVEAEVRYAAELAGVVDSQGRADIDRWFQMMTTEQKVSRRQYLDDAVWPSAALKKLIAGDITVEQDDIDKGFNANYGERVRCRAIVLDNLRRAQEVWKKARQNGSTEYFGDLAEHYSIEPTSRSLRGEVPPIQRHGGQQQLEDVAFGLQPDQLSGIIQIGESFVILRCEGRTERIEVHEEEVRDILTKDIYEKKLRIAMGQKFESLRENARIDNYLAGTSSAGAKPSKQSPSNVHRDTAVRQTGTQR